MIRLNRIGINVSSLDLSSGKSGLFSNERLVAVYDGDGMFCVEDLYRLPPNTLRYVKQWLEDLSIEWVEVKFVAPLVVERKLLDEQ